jgi:hypothetical protein
MGLLRLKNHPLPSTGAAVIRALSISQPLTVAHETAEKNHVEVGRI